MTTQQCRSCGATVVWLPTKSGKYMICEASSVQEGETEYTSGKHVAHWASCPQAKEWKRRVWGSSSR